MSMLLTKFRWLWPLAAIVTILGCGGGGSGSSFAPAPPDTPPTPDPPMDPPGTRDDPANGNEMCPIMPVANLPFDGATNCSFDAIDADGDPIPEDHKVIDGSACSNQPGGTDCDVRFTSEDPSDDELTTTTTLTITVLEDTDGDRLADVYETNNGFDSYVSPMDTGTDPNNVDTDGDGLEDGDEVEGGTNPTKIDSDDDGVPDPDDQCQNTDPGVTVNADGCPRDPNADMDGDGFSLSVEDQAGTSDDNKFDFPRDRNGDSIWDQNQPQLVMFNGGVIPEPFVRFSDQDTAVVEFFVSTTSTDVASCRAEIFSDELIAQSGTRLEFPGTMTTTPEMGPTVVPGLCRGTIDMSQLTNADTLTEGGGELDWTNVFFRLEDSNGDTMTTFNTANGQRIYILGDSVPVPTVRSVTGPSGPVTVVDNLAVFHNTHLSYGGDGEGFDEFLEQEFYPTFVDGDAGDLDDADIVAFQPHTLTRDLDADGNYASDWAENNGFDPRDPTQVGSPGNLKGTLNMNGSTPQTQNHELTHVGGWWGVPELEKPDVTGHIRLSTLCGLDTGDRCLVEQQDGSFCEEQAPGSTTPLSLFPTSWNKYQMGDRTVDIDLLEPIGILKVGVTMPQGGCIIAGDVTNFMDFHDANDYRGFHGGDRSLTTQVFSVAFTMQSWKPAINSDTLAGWSYINGILLGDDPGVGEVPQRGGLMTVDIRGWSSLYALSFTNIPFDEAN